MLVLGAAFLMIRGTGDATTADAPDDTVRVRDTDPERDDTAPDDTEPDTSIATTETTIVDDSIPPTGPRPTPPPLVEPPPATNETPADTTGATDVTTPKTTPPPPDPATTTLTTEGPPVDGPTVDDVRSALLLRADFSDPEWVADTPPPPDALCGENPDDENIVHREQVYFSRLTVEPTAFRQLSHTLYTYPDEATAARSFTTDVALLNDCAVDTVDVETTTYELAVNVDMFNAEDAATFPCSDDNALVVTQLNSAGADVPFLGEITAAFRCGIVVSVVSFGSTVSLDDLQDNDFFSAVAATNPRARELWDS